LKLPDCSIRGRLSFEEVLRKRRSIRDFSPEPVSLKEVSQMLWAAQGITGEEGFGRTCPSAGALYPLEIYILAKNVEKLEKGIYHFDVYQYSLEPVTKGDYSTQLAEACLGQMFIAQAPVVFIIGADHNRVTWKYGERGIRYVNIEVGHCGQNICLQATSLNLASVPVGAFWDKQVKEAVFMPESLHPLYIIPVGHPAK